jgi:hypothetical protein
VRDGPHDRTVGGFACGGQRGHGGLRGTATRGECAASRVEAPTAKKSRVNLTDDQWPKACLLTRSAEVLIGVALPGGDVMNWFSYAALSAALAAVRLGLRRTSLLYRLNKLDIPGQP